MYTGTDQIQPYPIAASRFDQSQYGLCTVISSSKSPVGDSPIGEFEPRFNRARLNHPQYFRTQLPPEQTSGDKLVLNPQQHT